MKDIYNDGTYLSNNPGWHEEGGPFKAKYIQLMLQKHHIPFLRLAEIGCGSGEILNILSKNYPEKTFDGFEISSDALAIAQKKSSANLHFNADDLLHENNTAQYDVLLVIDVFEHVEDYLGFLQRCRQKATYKLLHIPLDINVLDVLRYKRLSYKRKKAGHLHFFTKETAIDTLQHCGYEIVDCFYTPWAFEIQTSFADQLRNFIIKMVYALNKDWAPRLFGGFSLMVLAK